MVLSIAPRIGGTGHGKNNYRVRWSGIPAFSGEFASGIGIIQHDKAVAEHAGQSVAFEPAGMEVQKFTERKFARIAAIADA
jgi:hypothetical protein